MADMGDVRRVIPLGGVKVTGFNDLAADSILIPVSLR
jgi:hypothetical protein